MRLIGPACIDAVYFLDTDRIAREVTIQTIIIEEILKHRKQLIVNGKDYIKMAVLGSAWCYERIRGTG